MEHVKGMLQNILLSELLSRLCAVRVQTKDAVKYLSRLWLPPQSSPCPPLSVICTSFYMGWLIKRHSVDVQWLRAVLSGSQWWVELKKEGEFRRNGAKGGRRWGRSGVG